MVNRRSFFNVMLGAVASAAGVSVAKPIGAFVIIDPTKTWVLENGATAIQYGGQVASLGTGYISRSYNGFAGYFQGTKWHRLSLS